jgi:geranylgeranyl diphosphate synthase type I
MSLRQLTAEYLPAVEAELRGALGSGLAELREYYVMLEYHLGWLDEHGQPLPDSQASGKRLRPLLCLLSNAACGSDWQRALPMAAALELLHNFSLLHDDIQDASPLRRGRPTVWKLWGEAQAINAGDALFTLAHLMPHRLTERGVPPGIVLAALADFDRTCLQLTQGQYLDMRFETRARVTVDEYMTMIGGKTAALIAACTRLGALIAEAPAETTHHLSEYGRYLGLAFQVHDDWLGIWGDPAMTGKSAASDLEKRKKSLPVVYGLERSEEFAERYARPHHAGESVAELAAQLEALGAQTYTLATARALTEQAAAHLRAAAPTGPAAEALQELTDSLLTRNA